MPSPSSGWLHVTSNTMLTALSTINADAQLGSAWSSSSQTAHMAKYSTSSMFTVVRGS